MLQTKRESPSFVTGLLGGVAITDQFQITAAELAALGLNIGDQISGVRTRLNGAEAAGPASATNVTDLEITMATATNPISSMSNTFSSNMTGTLLVRDGGYTLPANSMPGGSTPNAFGAMISFDSAYTYQGGDLIFMYSRTAWSTSLIMDFASTYPGAGTAYRRLAAGGHQATGGTLSDGIGVFQFEIVPEPASLGVLGLAAVGLIGRRRA